MHPCERDGRFEREAEGEREDVSAFVGAGPEDFAGEAVMRMYKKQTTRFLRSFIYRVESGVVEARAEARGPEDEALTQG